MIPPLIRTTISLSRPDSGAAFLSPKFWLQTREHFFDSVQTLDWGHADQIALDLRQHAAQNTSHAKDLLTIANYFETLKRRTQYLEFPEEGYIIGSGMVESEAKQYKARFTGPGMRWSRDGLNHLLPVRTAIMSNTFDQLWQQSYNSPPN